MSDGKEFARAIGCDPGPSHSAFAYVVRIGPREFRVLGAWYAGNGWVARASGLDLLDLTKDLTDPSGDRTGDLQYTVRMATAGCCERVTSRGFRMVGASVFGTCEMVGVVCDRFRSVLDAYSIPSADWRLVLTGRSNASDSMVHHAIADIDPEGDGVIKDAARRAKSSLGLDKSPLPHMRDAAGVAIGFLLAGEAGFDPAERWEVGNGECRTIAGTGA